MASDDLYLHLENATLTGLEAVHAAALTRRPWRLKECETVGEWLVDDDLPAEYLADAKAALERIGLSDLDIEHRMGRIGFSERSFPDGAEIRYRDGYLFYRK